MLKQLKQASQYGAYLDAHAGQQQRVSPKRLTYATLENEIIYNQNAR